MGHTLLSLKLPPLRYLSFRKRQGCLSESNIKECFITKISLWSTWLILLYSGAEIIGIKSSWKTWTSVFTFDKSIRNNDAMINVFTQLIISSILSNRTTWILLILRYIFCRHHDLTLIPSQISNEEMCNTKTRWWSVRLIISSSK